MDNHNTGTLVHLRCECMDGFENPLPMHVKVDVFHIGYGRDIDHWDVSVELHHGLVQLGNEHCLDLAPWEPGQKKWMGDKGKLIFFFLTHWRRDKMAPTVANHFQFVNENISISIKISLKFVVRVQSSIGSNNGLLPSRRQAIIWTNDGIVYWCIAMVILERQFQNLNTIHFYH